MTSHLKRTFKASLNRVERVLSIGIAVCLYNVFLGLSVYEIPSMRVVNPAVNNNAVDDVISSLHSEWHPLQRTGRFPSVEDRVKLYFGDWYFETTTNSSIFANDNTNTNTKARFLQYQSLPSSHSKEIMVLSKTTNASFHITAKTDLPLVVDRQVLKQCLRSRREIRMDLLKSLQIHSFLWTKVSVDPVGHYCRDLLELLSAYEEYAKPIKTLPPLLAQVGDPLVQAGDIPVFAKWRPVFENGKCKTNSDNNHSFMPILWKFNTQRHWLPLEEARRVDTIWEKKISKAVWRGDMTGIFSKHDATLSASTKEPMSDWELCQANPRCSFVLRHEGSLLLDTGLVEDIVVGDNLQGDGTLARSRIFKEPLTLAQLQQYKIIVSLEGNDVSSGLKWNLMSSSVVLMPPPTKTSWAMEELLRPWVHYVPIHADGSDAEDKIRWILDNDDKARKIAERATLFMYDLLYHPLALEEEELVKKEMLRRYLMFWKEI